MRIVNASPLRLVFELSNASGENAPGYPLSGYLEPESETTWEIPSGVLYKVGVAYQGSSGLPPPELPVVYPMMIVSGVPYDAEVNVVSAITVTGTDA